MCGRVDNRLLALEPAVGAGPHILQRDDQSIGDGGLIDPGDAVAVDAAHIALLEIGDGVQVDSHYFDGIGSSRAPVWRNAAPGLRRPTAWSHECQAVPV